MHAPRRAALLLLALLTLAFCAAAIASAASPNTRIVFHTFRAIRAVDVDGANSRDLAREHRGSGANAAHFTDVSASKNGKRIVAVWSRRISGGRSTFQSNKILLFRGDGSNRKRLFGPWPASSFALNVNSVAISFDGRFVAFNRAGDLFVSRIGSGRMRKLVDGRVKDPSFSKDGRRIVFEQNTAGDQDVWVVNRRGGGPRRLTDADADETDPVFSPDGRLIAFGSDAGGGQLRMMRADGTRERRVTWTRAGERTEPDFSPGGGALVYVGRRNRRLRFFTVRVNGANKRVVSRRVGGKSPNWVRRP